MSSFRHQVNAILCKVKNGDKTYQKVLFDLTYNHLKAVAQHYAVHQEDCDDILQVSYLKAFTYIDSFSPLKDGYNWLCKIVQNTAYTFNSEIEPDTPLETLDNEAYFDFTEEFEDKDLLLSEIKKLSKYDQRIMYLRFWENLSYSEIAESVGGKKSTIHKRVSKILTQIQKNFKK